MDVLDNPVWHALTGAQATVAEGGPLAARYQADVAPFAGLPDDPGDDAWGALERLVGPGGVAILFRDPISPVAGWSEVAAMPVVQMVATAVEPAAAPDARPLGPDDVADMVALVGRTNPGPFGARTIELGTYLGVRDDGVLVAMAGERMRLPGYGEISAVCTDDAHRGKGTATRLVLELVRRINARGDRAMLHALTDNHDAIRLYSALGFTVRRQLQVTILRAPS